MALPSQRSPFAVVVLGNALFLKLAPLNPPLPSLQYSELSISQKSEQEARLFSKGVTRKGKGMGGERERYCVCVCVCECECVCVCVCVLCSRARARARACVRARARARARERARADAGAL